MLPTCITVASSQSTYITIHHYKLSHIKLPSSLITYITLLCDALLPKDLSQHQMLLRQNAVYISSCRVPFIAATHTFRHTKTPCQELLLHGKTRLLVVASALPLCEHLLPLFQIFPSHCYFLREYILCHTLYLWFIAWPWGISWTTVCLALGPMHYVLRSIVALHSFGLKLCSVKCIVQCGIQPTEIKTII